MANFKPIRVVRSGADAVALSEYQTGDTLEVDSVDINGGAIDNTVIGSAVPAVGNFTNIEDGAEVNNISDVNATDLTDGGDSSLHYHSADRDRANHSGTQLLSTISDAGTMAAQNATSVNIDGGTVDNTTIGATTPSTGAFTTLTSDIAIQRNRIDADLTVPDGYNMLSIAPIEINPDATITLAGNSTWRII